MIPNPIRCIAACAVAAACSLTACSQTGPYGSRPGSDPQQSGAVPPSTTQDANSRYDTRSPGGGMVPGPSTGDDHSPGAQPPPLY